jgi:hypothetical protein
MNKKRRKNKEIKKISFWVILRGDITRMIKSMRITWAWHVARMVAKRNACRILVGSQKERDH